MDTTTLFVTMYEGANDPGPVLGKGVLKIQPQDFAVQMGTMQVFNVDNDLDRMKWLMRVGQFFTGALFDTYGRVVAKPNRIDPTKPPTRKKRPLRMNPPELYYPMTADNVQLRLTRYRGGAKGPVVLSPGFGVSTMSFSTDTIDTNLPEYLYATAMTSGCWITGRARIWRRRRRCSHSMTLRRRTIRQRWRRCWK